MTRPGRSSSVSRGRLPRRGRRARRDARQADPRSGGREGAVRHRLRRPRVGRLAGRQRSVGASSRLSRWTSCSRSSKGSPSQRGADGNSCAAAAKRTPSGIFARPGVRASEFRVLRTTRLLASPLCKQERIASSPPGRDSRGFNRVRLDGRSAAACSGFVVYEEGIESLVIGL